MVNGSAHGEIAIDNGERKTAVNGMPEGPVLRSNLV